MGGLQPRYRTRAMASRMTISLPADLHQRMQAAGQEVNWSAVAREAFESEVSRGLQSESGEPMKMTIYIPDELHARMRGAEDTTNWSRLAQEAYFREMDRQASERDRRLTILPVWKLPDCHVA